MNIDVKTYTRYIVIFLILACLGYFLLDLFVWNSPVLNIAKNEQQSVDWKIQEDREKRNLLKMKRSYAELMELGKIYTEEEVWELANKNYFYAKTIFPDKIAPRKNLCYLYFMMCQDDWRYCAKGKKELYYAMKYVVPTDANSYEYLNQLVNLVGIDDIVEMEEGQALAMIF